ncbi:MAG: ATP-dependent DNA helicase RecG [Actinobacteria bacterium]|nr:ATP-dependent DNA helicase RecG [Actinomycetota bacterium]
MVGFAEDLDAILGARTAKALREAFGIRTVEDALRHYPRRYFRRGELTDLGDLSVDDDVTVLAEVASVTSRPGRRRTRGKPVMLTEVTLTDGRHKVTATFFNQTWREKDLRVGRRLLFAGRVSRFRTGMQLVHPDYEPVGVEEEGDVADGFAGAIIPVYPATSRVSTWRYTAAMEILLPLVVDLPDPLPRDTRDEHGLVGFAEAMTMIHAPKELAEIDVARHRLRFEEAFLLQAELLRRRNERRAGSAIPRTPAADGMVAALDERLPFALTPGQLDVAAEIASDMASTRPMLRLLQGDVGSGKTVVALRAMLAAVDAGAQAAFLAPTEVLAAQHFSTITSLLGPMAQRGTIMGDDRGTSVTLLTGSMGTRARRSALLAAASGEAGIIVGTHALMSDDVQFADLGLVVVDEQHRFGVEQRASLVAKATGETQPHTLVMTATPIPRTVAMTVFGDLDVSTLRERPAGRSPVTTHVVPALTKPGYLSRVWQRAREEVDAGHQVYVVCPRISSDGEPATAGYPPTAVEDLAAYVAAGPLQGLRIGGLHGQLDSDEKSRVMAAFAAGPADADSGIDVLIATTVVEVGVDVPNATLMVIIDADGFGVSSLHQLRGRVGRGDTPGLCLLVTAAEPGSDAMARLESLAATDDGFRVSMIDLATRREGDVLGSYQSGNASSLRLVSVLDDADLIELTRAAAAEVLHRDPALASEPGMREALRRLSDREASDFLEKA